MVWQHQKSCYDRVGGHHPLFMNKYNTIGGGCQTLTLTVNTSNSGYVYILTLTNVY